MNNKKNFEIDLEKPRTMVTQLYKTLERSIVKGQLYPGQPLKEQDLEKIFAVSRAPIREAIRLLEANGLVVVDDYKKKYVRKITRQYLQDLMPVVARLEGYAANLATKLLTPEQIGEIARLNKEMEEAYKQKHYETCSELNFSFHRTYVKAANNDVLNSVIRSMSNSIKGFWITNLYFKNHQFIPISISEHHKIIKEFMNRNSDKVEVLVRNHVVGMLSRSIKYALFDSEGVYKHDEGALNEELV
jgi:DNA-binding GntR family transcriptional regulator